jgi:hypothetical protein
MRMSYALVGVVLTLMLAAASPAAAHKGDKTFSCSGIFTGVTYDNVVVPKGAACTLIDSTVAGNVRALERAFFQSTGTAIGGDVVGRKAQTLFVDTGSRVFGSIRTYDVIQAFVFNSRVIRNIDVDETSEVVNICGSRVFRGEIEVEESGEDILIGDPQAVDCAGNLVRRGDIELRRNSTDVEFVVRGNTIRRGDLEVLKNKGPVPKFVEDNAGGDDLRCFGNGAPLFASDNTGWDEISGQCD